MTVERNTDWDAALNAYLDEKREADEPCAYFATGAVQAMTGVDLLAKFRGRMSWAREHLSEAADEVLEPRPVSFARAGDLVMKDGNLGVCHGEVSYFMALYEGQTGTALIDTLTCDKAWTVG
jgi:hypothetical protein